MLPRSIGFALPLKNSRTQQKEYELEIALSGKNLDTSLRSSARYGRVSVSFVIFFSGKETE